MSTNDPDVKTVHAWTEAVNAADTHLAASLATNDVRIQGPRGVATGSHALIDWIERTEIFIEILRTSCDNNRIIAECSATWAKSDGTPGRTFPVPTILVFDMTAGRISCIQRFESLEDIHRT